MSIINACQCQKKQSLTPSYFSVESYDLNKHTLRSSRPCGIALELKIEFRAYEHIIYNKKQVHIGFKILSKCKVATRGGAYHSCVNGDSYEKTRMRRHRHRSGQWPRPGSPLYQSRLCHRLETWRCIDRRVRSGKSGAALVRKGKFTGVSFLPASRYAAGWSRQTV